MTSILSNCRWRMLPPDALLDGLRIKPQLVRLAFENNGELSHELPLAVANQLFERLNRPEDVSFRYTIFDSGRGRELQNQPLHNIAGLGIADGDRPFKKLARSMIFHPRSTIRVRVEERFGRGTLFIVLQGYKILSVARRGSRAMNNGAQVNGFGESVAAPPAQRRTIPFDYVFRFDELKGQPGLVQNSTVEVSIEAAFTAVSIGYGVVPKVDPITFGLPPEILFPDGCRRV